MFVVRRYDWESSSVAAAHFEHGEPHVAPTELMGAALVVSTNMALLRSYDVAFSDEALDAARSAADEDVRAPYLESRAGSPTSMTV
jgi:hypothetical protein